MHVPMCGQGSGQDLLPKAYLEKGPRLGHPSVRVPSRGVRGGFLHVKVQEIYAN